MNLFEILESLFPSENDIILACAVTLCVLFGLFQFKVEWLKKHSNNDRCYFPNYIWYYGNTYSKETLNEKCIGNYLAYYSVSVLLISLLELIIEGRVGITAKLEIGLIASAILGMIVLGVLLSILGMLYGVFVAHRRNVAVAMTLIIWSEFGSYIGKQVGAIIGIVISAIAIKHWMGLSVLQATGLAFIPTMLVCIEVYVDMHRKIGIQKNYSNIPIPRLLYHSDSKIDDNEEQISSVVIPFLKKDRIQE